MSYLIRRLLLMIISLWLLSMLSFFLIKLIPGDPAVVLLGPRYSPEAKAAITARLGLDQPVIIQYGIWLSQLLQGDLGTSNLGEAITSLIGKRLLITAEIAGLALILGFSIGVSLGAISSIAERQRHLRAFTQLLGSLGVAIPNFWFASLLILIVSLQLGWLPASGYQNWDVGWRAHLSSITLPVVSLSLAVSSVMAKMSLASFDEVKRRLYIQTAKAKGLPSRLVWGKHAFRNALIPVLTVFGLQVGSLLGGSIAIEHVYAIPGLGSLLLYAVGARDYHLLQAIILLSGLIFLVMNLLLDLILPFINPALREDTP